MTARDNYFFVITRPRRDWESAPTAEPTGSPAALARPDNATMNSQKKPLWPWIVAVIALCLVSLMAWSAGPGGRDFLIGVAVLTTSAGVGIALVLRKEGS